MNPTTLTVKTVADQLGVSPWAVYDAVRRGEIPNVGVGRSVRIPARWLAERLASGGDAGGINPDPDDVAVSISIDDLARLAEIAHSAAVISQRVDDQQLAAHLDHQLAHAHAAAARTTPFGAPSVGVVRGAADEDRATGTNSEGKRSGHGRPAPAPVRGRPVLAAAPPT